MPSERRKKFFEHARITGTALKRWFLAQLQDALLVGLLWLIGLLLIGVPFAPLWAFLAMLLQFVPYYGTILSLLAPALASAFSDTQKLIYVLILYAVIVAVDGLVLQPLLMKRTAKAPVWASIVAPLALGILLNVWGLLLAPPLLAVIYTYRARRTKIPEP